MGEINLWKNKISAKFRVIVARQRERVLGVSQMFVSTASPNVTEEELADWLALCPYTDQLRHG